MEVIYKNEKIKLQCENEKAAKKLFGGNEALAISSLARINALKQAPSLKDIIVQKQYRFHGLKGDYKGFLQ